MQNKMMIESWVRYTHLEKLYGYLPGMDEELLAQLFGLDLEEYREIKDRFDANARDAARELLEEPGFAERVDRLPLREGDTVVVVGDSITDDLQSWLEIMRHLLEERRPKDGIRVVLALGVFMNLNFFLPFLACLPPLCPSPRYLILRGAAKDPRTHQKVVTLPLSSRSRPWHRQ